MNLGSAMYKPLALWNGSGANTDIHRGKNSPKVGSRLGFEKTARRESAAALGRRVLVCKLALSPS